MTLEDLLIVETIRTLRMQYSYYLDAGELDALVDLFSHDAVCEFGPFGVWRGKSEIAENYQKVMRPILSSSGFQSLHANTNHWVQVTGPDTASGRVYLLDFSLREPKANPLVWLGVYDEDYRLVGDQWKIARSSLQFLWPERHVTAHFPGKVLGGSA